MPAPSDHPSRHSRASSSRFQSSQRGANTSAPSSAQYTLARSATFFDETAKVETVLQSASLSRAVAYRDRTCPRKKNADGEYEAFALCQLNDADLRRFGLGSLLYFKLMRRLSYLFLVLFLLHTPSLYFNIHGVDGAHNSDAAILVKTTLGNQYAAPFNTTSNGTEPLSGNGDGNGDINSDDNGNGNSIAGIDKKDVGVICTALDVLSTIVFLLFFLITAAMNSRDADAYYASILTVSRYSVAVTKLPQRHIDRTEIRHFFSQFGPVVDVSILSSNFKLVELYCQRAHTRKQLSLAEQDVDHPNLSSCREKLAAVDAAIVEERDQHISKPVAAFVTFEKQEDSDACIAAYGDSWWFTLFMPSHLRYNGHRISVQRAPEPSNILYHNLSYSRMNKNCRRLGSFIATVAMLSITTAIVYIAQYVHNNKIPQVNECDGTNSPPPFYHEADPATWSLSVRDCWCSALSFADLISNRALCDDYIQSYALNTSLVVLTALTTVIINTAIQIVTMYISAVEKHSSRSSAQKGMAKKIAIGLTLNTGIIIFLVNLDLSSFWENILGIGFFSSAGGFTDLTREWFVTVGTSLLITMMIGIFNPSLFSVAMVLYDRCRRNMFTGIKSNQDELNQLFRGRQMTLDQRYAVTTATLYVCYMYSGGMPILLLIAAITFGLTYWCDRYAFIHAYRIPPRYSESLDELALRWLPPAAVLHLIMSCWFFSSPLTDSYRVSTGSSEDNWLSSVGWLPFNIAERVVQWNVLPLFVLLMLLLAQFAFRGLFTAVSTLFICRHCCNSSSDRLSRILPAYFDFGIAVGVRPTYFEACSRVRMESYRLSKQPHWRIAYMITASNHQLAAENDFDDVAPILATIRQPIATTNAAQRQSLWAAERVEGDGDNASVDGDNASVDGDTEGGPAYNYDALYDPAKDPHAHGAPNNATERPPLHSASTSARHQHSRGAGSKLAPLRESVVASEMELVIRPQRPPSNAVVVSLPNQVNEEAEADVKESTALRNRGHSKTNSFAGA